MVDSTVVIGELEYRELSEDEYLWIGINVYRASELDASLCQLAAHLAVLGRDSTEHYEAAYDEYVGSQQVIARIRKDLLVGLDQPDRNGITSILDHAEELLGHRHSLVHGQPRESGDEGFLMVRKRPPSKKTQHLSLGEKLSADHFNLEALKTLADHLLMSHRRVYAATMYFWPTSQGPAPVRVDRKFIQDDSFQAS